MTAVELNTMNQGADYWRHDVGMNVIPAVSRAKTPAKGCYWQQHQDKPISQEQHEKWKKECAFDNGIAVINGKVWHNRDKQGYYLNCIDVDNAIALQELLTRNGKVMTLEELSKRTIVEQHKDQPDRVHVYVYTIGKPLRDKTSDMSKTNGNMKEIPAFEVKASSKFLSFVSPSIHKNGHKIEILGSLEPMILGDTETVDFQKHLDNICKKYNISYSNGHGDNNDKIPILELFKVGNPTPEGHNRHERLLRHMDSIIATNKKKLTEQQMKEVARMFNTPEYVNPALDDKEFEDLWKQATEFIASNNSNEKQTAEETEEDNKKAKIVEFIGSLSDKIRELFVDKYDTAFASVKIDRHMETLPVKGSRFKRWICRVYYEELGNTIRAEQLNQITDLLESKALFEGRTIDLQLRVNRFNDTTYYYDLTNKDWQIIKLTENNWTVEESANSPIMFTRYKTQIGQVTPSKEYRSDILDRFMDIVNVKTDESKILLECYLISLFIPSIPKPILMLHGEQGAAKTMLEELVKSIVDPSGVPTLTFPRTIEELIQQLSHNYLAFYDNLSIIRGWTSDQLCRAVTGSGFSKRELYSDDDDIIYNFKRAIGFSGISLAASKADLLDRGIIVELLRIPDNKRLKEEDVRASLEAIKPELLGYIFDVLVQVIKIQNNGGITLETRTRMADFEEYAEIISRVIGHEPNKFIEAYRNNRKLQTDVVLEGSPVATAIIQLLDEPSYAEMGHCWTGTATDLLKILELYAEQFKIDTKSKSWVKSANVLSNRLTHDKTTLRDMDIEITWVKDTKTRVKRYTIKKTRKEEE